MENKEVVLKVTNVEELVSELSFMLEDVKIVLKELGDKKEALESLKKIETIRTEMEDFKNFIDEFKKIQDDFTFLMRATNTTIADFKKEIEKFEKHYETLSDILDKQISKINIHIENKYDEMFKRIKQALNANIDETLDRIKELDKMLTEIYEKDYLNDVRKLKTQQKITNFLLIALIAAGAFFAYNVNKKLNYIQTTTYYNYKVLYNQ
jgi:chromosome segregation ATPase